MKRLLMLLATVVVALAATTAVMAENPPLPFAIKNMPAVNLDFSGPHPELIGVWSGTLDNKDPRNPYEIREMPLVLIITSINDRGMMEGWLAAFNTRAGKGFTIVAVKGNLRTGKETVLSFKGADRSADVQFNDGTGIMDWKAGFFYRHGEIKKFSPDTVPSR